MEYNLTFKYKNYKGDIKIRSVVPKRMYFGCTPYHKEEQWLLEAYDLDKKDIRVFAVRDILSFN